MEYVHTKTSYFHCIRQLYMDLVFVQNMVVLSLNHLLGVIYFPNAWYSTFSVVFLMDSIFIFHPCFAPCSEALSRLNAVIRHPNALQSDNVMAYDNAVSALGKICHFHRDSIDSTQVVLTSYQDYFNLRPVLSLICKMCGLVKRTLLLFFVLLSQK